MAQRDMRMWTYGIWFVGSGVWLLVSALTLRYHSTTHSLVALVVAILFFAAGMFFSKPGNQPGQRR